MKTAGPGSPDIEAKLGRIAPLPVPPGLRRKVLGRAAEAGKSKALTPGLRTLSAACAVLIAAILVIDPLVGRHEATRLAALLDGRSAAHAASQASELVEIFGGKDGEADQMARLQHATAAVAPKHQEHQVTEAWRRLKGWLENETQEDPI
jgi:hypothetical protein